MCVTEGGELDVMKSCLTLLPLSPHPPPLPDHQTYKGSSHQVCSSDHGLCEVNMIRFGIVTH